MEESVVPLESYGRGPQPQKVQLAQSAAGFGVWRGWGRDDGRGEGLYQMLGQRWLSEQAGSERRVLALDEEQDLVVDQTTEQRLLMRVKQVLKDRALMLYAQPIQNPEGEGYHEILTRMRCGDSVIMPDRSHSADCAV